jgi:hypothetical protein
MEHRSQLSLGADTHSQTVALAWNPSWTCCDVSWFRFGTGVRFSAFHGRDLVLETAEYDLIDADQTSSLTNADAQIYAFNAFISADVQASDWLFFGFNLDLVGVSSGPDQTASYGEAGFEQTQRIRPMQLNLFRWALRDIGTLNSEFFAAVPIDDTWGIRLGLSHFFAEMESTSPLKYDGERFRTIQNLGMLSVTYNHN